MASPAPATAPIGWRAAARLADVILVMAPAWLIVVPIVLGFASAGATTVVALAVGWSVTIGYETIFTARNGQTIGKRATGLRVVDTRTGRPPTLAASLRRAALPPALGVVTAGVGWVVPYLWAIWAPDRRGLHDRIAGTHVIVVTDPPGLA